MSTDVPPYDSDTHKGAIEDDAPYKRGVDNESNTSMAGQNAHRGPVGTAADGTDTDFPEPDAEGEHTGQHE